MNIDEARRVLRNDDESFMMWVTATAEITSSEESSLEDILACMQRRGLPAEMAATSLYARTKRPRVDTSLETFVVDRRDWIDYLKSQGLLASEIIKDAFVMLEHDTGMLLDAVDRFLSPPFNAEKRNSSRPRTKTNESL